MECNRFHCQYEFVDNNVSNCLACDDVLVALLNTGSVLYEQTSRRGTMADRYIDAVALVDELKLVECTDWFYSNHESI